MEKQTSSLTLAGKILWSVLSLYGAYTIMSNTFGYILAKNVFVEVISKKPSLSNIQNSLKDSNVTMRFEELADEARCKQAVDNYDKSVDAIANLGFFETVFLQKDIEALANFQTASDEYNHVAALGTAYLIKHQKQMIEALR